MSVFLNPINNKTLLCLNPNDNGGLKQGSALSGPLNFISFIINTIGRQIASFMPKISFKTPQLNGSKQNSPYSFAIETTQGQSYITKYADKIKALEKVQGKMASNASYIESAQDSADKIFKQFVAAEYNYLTLGEILEAKFLPNIDYLPKH